MKKELEKIMKMLEDIEERLKKLEMTKKYERWEKEIPPYKSERRCPCCGAIIHKHHWHNDRVIY